MTGYAPDEEEQSSRVGSSLPQPPESDSVGCRDWASENLVPKLVPDTTELSQTPWT